MTAAGQIASAALVPVAHIGHWLWVFYVLPVIIVIAGIFWSTPPPTLANAKRKIVDPCRQSARTRRGREPLKFSRTKF